MKSKLKERAREEEKGRREGGREGVGGRNTLDRILF